MQETALKKKCLYCTIKIIYTVHTKKSLITLLDADGEGYYKGIVFIPYTSQILTPRCKHTLRLSPTHGRPWWTLVFASGLKIHMALELT